MIFLNCLGTPQLVGSYAYIERNVDILQVDEKAGVIVRRQSGAVISCPPESLFTNEEDAKAAEVEFYKRELVRVTEAYEKKIAELEQSASVG